MNIPTHNRRLQQRGVTLIELIISLAIAAMLLVGLRSVMGGVLGSDEYLSAHNALVRDAEFAMDRMVRAVSHSRKLLLPYPDRDSSDWPEHIREETVPASPPIGSSIKATAVLAVTLPAYSDLDFDGFPDADNDRDGRIDEDVSNDRNNDFLPGIYLIDDDGDGWVDESPAWWWDDDEFSSIYDEDPENGFDDDGDNHVDEDPSDDANGDGCPGRCGVDDDADGQIDEGATADDDEDGQSDEDWYDALVFSLNGGELIERVHVPWDISGGGIVGGQDFIVSTIAEDVTRLRFERVPTSAGQPELIDITLELTTPEAGTVAVNSRVRIGGAL